MRFSGAAVEVSHVVLSKHLVISGEKLASWNMLPASLCLSWYSDLKKLPLLSSEPSLIPLVWQFEIIYSVRTSEPLKSLQQKKKLPGRVFE